MEISKFCDERERATNECIQSCIDKKLNHAETVAALSLRALNDSIGASLLVAERLDVIISKIKVL